MEQLIKEILRLCQRYETCRLEVERGEECQILRDRLSDLCGLVIHRVSVTEPGMILALMNAYEVTRDEGILQEVLDVVSGELERLPVAVESVKLLAYCYYYVEEEECAERAGKMMEELRREGKDVKEAELVMREIGIMGD